MSFTAEHWILEVSGGASGSLSAENWPLEVKERVLVGACVHLELVRG